MRRERKVLVTMRLQQATTDLVRVSDGAQSDVMRSEDLSDVLSEFARTMLTDFPIQGILDHLVKRIVDILPITAAGVTLIAPGLEPHYVAASDESALRYEKLQTELGEGPCLAAYRSGEAISVPDLRLEDRFPVFAPRALESGLTAVFTFPLRHADAQLGALDLYHTSAGPLSAAAMSAAQTLADVAAAYLINAQARSDLQNASDQSREAALHDGLTALPNRVLMLQLVDRAARASRRAGNTSAVLFIDLDRFKEVNDTYGHRVGDELLAAVAERLTALLRPGDSLARMSGDEFVALCEDLPDSSAVDAIAVRFDAALSAPFRLSGIEVNTTASIGIAITDQGSQTPDELIHDADLAMYRQKRERIAGQDGLDLRKLRLARRHAGLAHSLPGAIDRGELHVEYQPIVDATDGQLTAVEALLRWTHPGRGPVSPTVFIPFAEQSGQIIELGQWVLEQAWTDRDLWQEHRAADIGLAVNVSAHQFMTAGFTETIAKILDRTSTDPSLLTLEVTESVFVRDEQRAVVVLNEIKDIGVKLALDDFGTGYSSLGYLTTLPIDSIKIDRTFTAKLTKDPDSQRIVTAIIQLAHSLGMTVVSEGVETASQHHELTQLGSDSCQGFYFARPMPATSLTTFIQHPRPAERPTPPNARRHQHSTGNIQSRPRYRPPATVDAVRQADARDQQCPTRSGDSRPRS
jgi:diguanylate cyclase (GGDEF)-like protein